MIIQTGVENQNGNESSFDIGGMQKPDVSWSHQEGWLQTEFMHARTHALTHPPTHRILDSMMTADIRGKL